MLGKTKHSGACLARGFDAQIGAGARRDFVAKKFHSCLARKRRDFRLNLRSGAADNFFVNNYSRSRLMLHFQKAENCQHKVRWNIRRDEFQISENSETEKCRYKTQCHHKACQ